MEENNCPEGMLGSYLYECFQLLEQLETIVFSQGEAECFDADSINEVFRIMHTIKSSSGIMMYDNIAMAAHKLEDIFYYLRESAAEDVNTAELTEYIFQVSDFITEELNKIKEGRDADGEAEPIAEKIDAYLLVLKAGMQEKGMELPPENIYTPPRQYYIAPAAEKKENVPLKIDLGEEPKPAPEMKPGDYVIGGQENKKERLVGVSMEKLEKLTVLVEKLLQLEQKAQKRPDAEEVWNKLNKVSAELENTLWDMRQAPVGTILRKMKRTVYDVSQRLSKDIELKLEGEELLVDRMILEQLNSPLIHLVRNAADHGIEDLAGRRMAGKSDKGTILLSARLENGRLFLSVKDDGKGLDAEKIFERAKLRGMVDADALISDYEEQEIFEFITMAGFSTRDEVTEISGRGVGMDVAAGKVREMGGKLHMQSAFGIGTEITIEIPVD